MKKEYIVLIIVLVILALLLVFKDRITAALTAKSTPAAKLTSTAVSQPPANLDYNLVLKRGSKNSETKRLQQLLEITDDGIFGTQTETALYDRKGVKQITLNEFVNVYADMGGTEPAPGDQNTGDIINWSNSNGDGLLGMVGDYILTWIP